MGKQKLQWAIFSVRYSRRFFRDHKSGPKNAVNFLNREGQKRGATQPSEGAFYLCTLRSNVKGAKTLLFAKE